MCYCRQKGITLPEVLISGFLLAFFAMLFFRSFHNATQINKKSELRSRSVYGIANFLELFQQQNGTLNYYALEDGKQEISQELLRKVGFNHVPITKEYVVTTYALNSEDSDDQTKNRSDGVKKVVMTLTYDPSAQGEPEEAEETNQESVSP